MLNLNLERYGRLALNGTEQSKLHLGNGVWERAVVKDSTKGASSAFSNTRKTGGDGTAYPIFSPTQVLPSVKAYGKTIEEKLQEELWGRYVPVEYIESHGTEYIDLGLVADINTKAQLDYQVTDITRGVYLIFGATDNKDNANSFFVRRNVAGTATYANFSSTPRTVVAQGPNDVNRHMTVLSKDGWYVDDTLYATWTNPNNFTSGNLYVFNISGYTTSEYILASAKVYSLKLWDNGVLVRDFVPVKDTVNNVYGMWDRVGKKFYVNAGTGAFTAGGEIKRIDYLESSGVEYITTENQYTVSNTDTIKTKYQYVEGSSSARIMSVGLRNQAPWFNLTSSTGEVSGTLQYGLGKTWIDGPAANFTTVYDSVINGYSVVINGYKYGSEIGTYSITDVLELFRGGYKDTYKIASVKLYYFEIEGKINLVPVKIGTTGYLLDTVEWKLYANAGTGDFVCGPEIPNRLIVPYILSGHKGEIKYENGAVHADDEHNITLGTQGVVDLGSLNWYAQNNGFNADPIDDHASTGTIFTEQYPTAGYYGSWSSAYNQGDKKISVVTGPTINSLFIRDDSFSTPEGLKSSLAGKYLFYQRTEDTEFVAPITKQIQDLLYSANSYKDLQTGEVWRDWAIKVLDGTEAWDKNNSANFYRVPTSTIGAQAEANGFSTHFEYGSLSVVGRFSIDTTYTNFYMPDNITMVGEWKAWLAEQYAAGTPVIIVYPLANPTSAPGEADMFTLDTKGQKTLVSDVAGTALQAEYLGK